MENKKLIGIAVLCLIVIGSVVMYAISPKEKEASQDEYTPVTPITSAPKETIAPNTTPTDQNPTPVSNEYTLAQVTTHNSSTNCWVAIRGNVYNVTPWITQHPGGQEAILSLCGTDGTAAFTTQHSGQPRPEQELKSFLIGTLK
jgi:cytochrome b involved in lipid metabolism